MFVLLLAAFVVASPARADFDFALTTGSTFNSGSGIALSTNPGLYTGSRTLQLVATATADPQVLDVEVNGINPMPDVTIALDPTRFEFTIPSPPQLTFDRVNGINPSLADALVQVVVERRTSSGALIDSDVYDVPFTTGTISLPACGISPPRDLSGSFIDSDPDDGMVDEVVLTGAVCMVDFGGAQNFNTPLEIKFFGSMMEVCGDPDDGVACTVDVCDPVTFEITNTPSNALCDDANMCNGLEVCDPVLDCQAGTPPVIDDGVACTIDSCDPVSGISNTPSDAFCSDGDVCTGLEICDPVLDCQAGTPLVVDDGVACTIDSCDPVTGVSNAPDDGFCADGNLCNGIEFCDGALDCQAGTPPDVDDGVACTVDSCDPLTGVSHVPDDAVCSDGNLCNGVEFCDALLDCRPSPPPQIDDGISCTLDSCDPIDGVSHVPDDSLCADGNLCNGDEICSATLDCQAGTPPQIDDGVACTLDSCDPVTGVSNLPDDTVCDDANVCNGAEICDAVLDCQAGTPLPIDDGVSCTVDSCDPVSGVSNVPSDSICGDADVCNGVETCDAVLDCQAGTPLVVDDGIDCTLDQCDPVTGVSNLPLPSRCGDGDQCNGQEICNPATGCEAGVPPVVDDGIDCTIDACHPTQGITHIPDESLCSDGDVCNGIERCSAVLGCLDRPPPIVDDGVACTIDSCDPVTGVSNLPDDSICGDADICNGIELCDPVLDCQAGTPLVVDDGVGCTVDSCDPVTGVANVASDALCDDANVCTGDEVCDPVLDCQGGTPLVVDDGVGCTVDSCDPVTGVANVATDALCSDADVCNGVETCDAVLDCQVGTPPQIDDGVDCTVDSCDPVAGVANVPNDGLCTDGDLCNGTEVCTAGLGCEAGTPPVVDDGVTCTLDSCDPLTGVANVPDDSICGDSDVCNGVESCDPVLDCQAGTPLVVDDGVGCTVDSCDPVAGVANLPNDSLCDDSDICTGTETCDALLDCQAGTALVADDGVGCTVDSCDPVTGVANVPSDSLCDDANVCTGIETCDALLDCQAGTPLALDDGIDCTIDSCDPVAGVSNLPANSRCQDGDVCNGVEICDAQAGCGPGVPLVADDGVDCTLDSCDPILGVVNEPFDIVCDDGLACTGVEICDLSLGCVDGEPPTAFAHEDFETLPLQFDDRGVFVPALNEILYRILDDDGVVGTVASPINGEAGVRDVAGNGHVWMISGATVGPFLAEALIPPEAASGFPDAGPIADALREGADLRPSLMCIDARDPGQVRDVDIHVVVGDEDGNFATSTLRGPLAPDFETFEFDFTSEPLVPVAGSGPVDLSRVRTLGVEFTTTLGGIATFDVELDNIRLIPEPAALPNAAVALGTLAGLWALGRRRRR